MEKLAEQWFLVLREVPKGSDLLELLRCGAFDVEVGIAGRLDGVLQSSIRLDAK
jgi:hypothetical protein